MEVMKCIVKLLLVSDQCLFINEFGGKLRFKSFIEHTIFVFQRFYSIEQRNISCLGFCNCFSRFCNTLFNLHIGFPSNTILNIECL